MANQTYTVHDFPPSKETLREMADFFAEHVVPEWVAKEKEKDSFAS
ncbi:hypothetical protein [Jeotgalibacillus campisalis]|uniref:Uncharacterized protein n=1 Tax=Jeotgalibacillus campisalis TaxID=220754 RepID=A0A0C2VB76_9BACL|nr:hypothetical protein [Jeotgalibacillus campisalis]KIL46192.1 hypothetical protein KR50_28670 [Jeotgalibacillus campisalis]